MKIHTFFKRNWVVLVGVLTLCLFGVGGALAQETIALGEEDQGLFFEGLLSDGNDSEGNQMIFEIAINEGDEIIATALCETDAEGLRPIDTTLSINAPQTDGSLEGLAWYNDDSDTVIECAAYRSSQISFIAPVSGVYEFVVENVSVRSGPFSLTVLGSTAEQLAMASGGEAVADAEQLSDDTEQGVLSVVEEEPEDTGGNLNEIVPLSFYGQLASKNDPTAASEIHEVLLQEGDQVTADLICEDETGAQGIDPALSVYYVDDEANGDLSWKNDDHDAVPECYFFRSARVEFVVPLSGYYAFQVRNLAPFAGDYSLNISIFSSQPISLSDIQIVEEQDAGDDSLNIHIPSGEPSESADTQSETDIEELSADDGGDGETDLAVSSEPAAQEPAPNKVDTDPGDMRLGDLGEIGAVFLVEMNGHTRLDVYAVDSTSVGHHVLSVYAEQVGAAPASETLLASGQGGRYAVYHLADGTLRISAGPNDEGKIYHMYLSGIPGSVLRTHGEVYDAGEGSFALAAPVVEAQPEILTTHTVQAGETLYSISVSYGVSYEAVAAANGIGADYIIHVGAELKIPAP